MKTTKDLLLLLAFCTIAFLLFPSFQEEKPRDRIREEVDKKLTRSKQIQITRCRDKMFEKAGAIADSILVEQSRMKARDSLFKPPVPPRPIRPEVLLPKDTSSLEPFLDENNQEKVNTEVEVKKETLPPLKKKKKKKPIEN